MFLKSLEIRGFKSFADKTELKFNEGITAVVGPNGSGKSNVSDAVRWVLGEQSARTLRGSKMEDIIFTGTEYRKPIGFAQVSLTLDNSDEELPIDYSAVKVTRRIFRSGESEYLINNSPCRLKDITTLFMDTGIGKEGYSLIGQGKIDAILSGKPEERRALLEEAAGIVKFKSRKNEAEKKLGNTRENLVRINDIIFTYEERLGPLEVEKNKAIEYMELATELQKSEVALIINNLVKLEGEIETQKNKINELININSNQKEEYKKKREELAKLKTSLEELENNYSNEQKQYFFKKENISKSLSEIELLQERINNIEDSIVKNEKEIQESNSKVEVLVKEKENLENEYKENKNVFEEFNSKIEEVESKVKELVIELQGKEKQAQELKDKELQLLRDISTAKNKKVMLESELNTLEENISSLKGNQEKFENSLKINLATKVNLEKEHSDILIRKDEISASIDAKNNEKGQLEYKITEIQKQLNRVSSELHRVEANKEILKKLEAQYEGYNVSVKKIMESINSGKLNIDKSKCVVFGEAIKTSSGYETAIEISVGAAISNIITEDEETAKYLINYLKHNKLGRATFLPLSTIRANKLVLNKDVVSTKGYLGIASDLVEYDPRYNNVVNNILGKTIICDNIDNALIIAKKIQYRNRIVTLSGEVVNAGGALTGGSIYQKNMGIMSRKTEFEALAKKIDTITSEKKKVTQWLENSLKTREDLESARQELIESVYATNLEAADVKNKINNIDEEVLKLKNSFKIIEFEFKSSSEKITNTKEQLNIILEKIDEFESLEISNKETLEGLNLRIKDISSTVSEIRESSTDLKVKKAQVEEIIEGKIKEINRNTREIEELKTRIVSLKSYVEQNTSVKAESLEKIEYNSTFIKDEKNELLLLEENAKAYELKKAQLKQDISTIEGNLEFITVEVAKKDDEIHRNEIIFTKQENERNIYYSRLREEFSTTYEEEKKDFVPIVNLDSHRQGVNRLKSKIAALGSVNVNAIEEFKELSEKYRFITTEKEDLEKAQEELVNVIEEMTSKMRVVFRQNFAVLNRYFDETFKELFKGGSAKLLLAEGDELTGNIEINVQPPGKKVQNINLMSGGEKVLSAIAILFAILKMKPTPFCILDEIEAALDDANVNRYADFLRKFSHNIQFIVITHRKGTMEAADVMYGVTMEEKGVSKVVSVDLSK